MPKQAERHVELVREGEHTTYVHVMLQGFACCYTLLPSGRRQIFSYLVPGDSCDLHAALLKKSDYSVGTLTECQVARIDRATILNLTEKHPAIARALWWSALVDAAILRQWITGIGQRRADQRIGHLFCELHARLKAVGMAIDGLYELPISQLELADTVGLSIVHVNRSLKALRQNGLATFRAGTVNIHDGRRLGDQAGFDAGYLHLAEAL